MDSLDIRFVKKIFRLVAIIIITVFSPCMRVKCKDKQQVQNVLTAVNLIIGLVLQFYFNEIRKTIKYLFFRFGNNVKWMEKKVKICKCTFTM